MNILYAPWRSEYASDTNDGKNNDSSEEACVFCKQIASNKDQENGIIKRFKHTVVVLNKYPYNAGHLLILPIGHEDSISKLSTEVRNELMNVLGISIDTLQATLKPDGTNVGINLGKTAGAGIPAHLHVHILPRWQGDTNFMPTIAQTKVVSFDLATVYKQLQKAFEKVTL